MVKFYTFFRAGGKVILSLILSMTIGNTYAQNLIANGDAETVPVVGAPWADVGNDGGYNPAIANRGPWYLPDSNYDYRPNGAFHGTYFFCAGTVNNTIGFDCELKQDISVSAYTSSPVSFSFIGHYATDGVSLDIAKIIVEYYDITSTILASFDSGNSPSDGAWHTATDIRNAPPGTDFIRIRLIGHQDIASSTIHAFFDSLSLTVGAPLPITLLTFHAAQKPDRTVDLLWQTAQEQNSSYIEVQRSGNGKDFDAIGKVPAAGNSSKVTDYSFADRSPLAGNGFYRLRLVDLDGKYNYSKIVEVYAATSVGAVQVLNNPFHEQIKLKVGSTGTEQLTLTLTDLLGRVYIRQPYSTRAGNNFIDLYPAAAIPEGVYLLNIQGTSLNHTIKLLKH